MCTRTHEIYVLIIFQPAVSRFAILATKNEMLCLQKVDSFIICALKFLRCYRLLLKRDNILHLSSAGEMHCHVNHIANIFFKTLHVDHLSHFIEMAKKNLTDDRKWDNLVIYHVI